MGRKHPSLAISLAVGLFVVLSLFVGLQGQAAVARVTDALVINEIDSGQPSSDALSTMSSSGLISCLATRTRVSCQHCLATARPVPI